MLIISLHISCVLRWSGINLRVYGPLCTTLLHTSWVLSQSEGYVKRSGSSSNASLHNSCVLNVIRDRYHKVRKKLKGIHFIFIFRLGQWAGDFVSDNFKTTIRYFHDFSVSHMHQSCHLDRCQAVGKSSLLIFVFWALRF